jgi:hypothetical protein
MLEAEIIGKEGILRSSSARLTPLRTQTPTGNKLQPIDYRQGGRRA